MYLIHTGCILTEIRCDNLSTPSEAIISSSSGGVGVGYEGDNCSFSCNTGYELTGNNTRTCQSDGTWSGSDIMCVRGTYIQYRRTYVYIYSMCIYIYIYI